MIVGVPLEGPVLPDHEEVQTPQALLDLGPLGRPVCLRHHGGDQVGEVHVTNELVRHFENMMGWKTRKKKVKIEKCRSVPLHAKRF